MEKNEILTADKILRSASTLFSADGYFNTSVEDIAKNAGIAKGTVYIYYKSKSKIFEAVALDGLKKLWSKLLDIKAKPQAPADMIRMWVSKYVEMMCRFPDLTVLLMSEAPMGIEPKVFEETQCEKQRYMRMQAKVLDDGQRAGYFKKCDSLLFVNGMAGFCYEYCKAARRQGKSVAEISEEISEIISVALLLQI